MTQSNTRDDSAISQTQERAGGAFFGEASVIALFTGLAYAAAFAFESGRAGYFGYPLTMISIQLSNALVALGAVLIVAAMLSLLGLVAYFGASLIPYRPVSIVFRTLWREIGCLVMIGLAALWMRAHNPPWPVHGLLQLAWLFLVLAFVMVEDIPGLVKVTREFRHKMPVLEIWDQVAAARWKHYTKMAEPGSSDDTIGARFLEVGWLAQPFAFLVMTAIPALLAIAGLAFLGEFTASRERHFLVTVEEPRVIVLSRYGDYFVTARYDDSLQTVFREFSTIPVSGDRTRLFRDLYIPDLTVSPPCHDDDCRW